MFSNNLLRIVPVLLIAFVCSSWMHGAGVIPKYYWAAAGNDSNNCLTPATACQTITHFNAFSFSSGDVVAFNGGDTFSGGLSITTPMTVTAYGSGQPTISSGNSTACVVATNIPSIAINNINCTGGGNTTNTTDGITIVNNQAGNTQLAGPTITNSTITGYGADCIRIGGNNGHSGFTGITITGNSVHDCTGNQIGGSAPYVTTSCILINNFAIASGFAHDNQSITISNNTVFNCTGTHSSTNAVGVGISVFNSGPNIVAQNNVVHDSGANNDASSGPVGIIFAGVTGGLMQFNEVYNMTTNGGDGEGIDFDANTINSIMQYNYTHNNTNSEILSGDFGQAGAWNNNIIRFNIAEATKSGTAGIHFVCSSASSGCTNGQIYNNTFVMSSAADGINAACNSGVTCSFTVANNIFLQLGAHTATEAFGTTGTVLTLTLVGNDYFGNAFSVTVGATTYTSLATLQAAGYEKVGGNPVGTTLSPRLVNAGVGTTCGGYVPPCPSGDQLARGSPMGTPNGQNLNTLYRFGVGTQDFYGNTVAQNTLPIGAAANTAATTYQGPGDVVASATFWYGLRAYNQATMTNAAINVCNVGDAACVDMVTDGLTGALVITNVGGSSCSSVTCTIKKFYDQTQAGNCSGSCDLIQNTIANRATLVVNCVNSQPCAYLNGSSVQYNSAGSISFSTPYTFANFMERVGGFTARQDMISDDTAGHVNTGYNSATNQIFMCNPCATATASDSAFHSLQMLYSNSAGSSSATVDGSTTGSLNTGTPSFGTGTVRLGNSTLTLNYELTETGLWGIAFSGTQLTNMNSNQAAFW